MEGGRVMWIYPIDLYEFSRKYIVLKNTNLSVDSIIESFLEKSKVSPQKYAGKLLSSILLNFFNEYEDLQYIYERYFFKEYDTFEEYLLKNMLIDKDEIELLMSKKKIDEKLYFVDLRHAVTDNDENLFRYEEVNFLNKINMILEEIE
ncbi:MAG: hypothetical protein E7222_05530 [Clostridiales bacterium]|nr:hypothetical protein [Clostridiales bacterium]